MDSKKIILKFKIYKYLNLAFFILSLFVILFFEKDIFTLFFPNANIKFIPFPVVLILAVVIPILYFVFYFLIQMEITKILKNKCDPKVYREVYFAISPKKNYIGKKLVDITTEFMLGNFNIAKTLCYEVIKNDSNINLRQTAYVTLAQIYLIEGDNENLTLLRNSANDGVAHPKYGKIYFQIANTATVFIELLVGDYEIMLKAYSKTREICKNKCDLYVSLFYYTLALVKADKAEEALPILEEIMQNANKLFVSHYAKMGLLYYATK